MKARDIWANIYRSLHPTHKYAPWIYGTIVFMLVVGYYTFTYVLIEWIPKEKTTSWLNPGTFGDTFGAINALFTGLAFAGFLISLALQRQEMGHQREQLDYQRKDLENQVEQLKLQTQELADQRAEMQLTREELERQRNENNLFNLLDARKRYIESLRISSGIQDAVEKVMVDTYFLKRPGSNDIDQLTGNKLLKYMADVCYNFQAKRASALANHDVPHISYLLGGANDLARIFLAASGLEESDGFLREFIEEKFGKSFPLYEKIYWNSLSADERSLLKASEKSLDSPGLPRIKIAFEGIRPGRQPLPNDGFLEIVLLDDASVDDDLLEIPVTVKENGKIISGWTYNFEGGKKIRLPVFRKSHIENYIQHQGLGLSGAGFWFFNIQAIIRIRNASGVFQVMVSWIVVVFDPKVRGIEFWVEEDK